MSETASPGGVRRRLRSRGAVEREHAAAVELQHRLLFEHNPLPMLVYERDTLRIVAVSNSAVAAYGYPREEFLAMTLLDLTPVDERAQLNSELQAGAFRRHRPGLQTSVRRHRRRDGSVIDVEVTSDDLDLGTRGCRIVLCQDVSERNRVMTELLDARERLRRHAEESRLLFERNPQPLVVYDCETKRIVAVSDACAASSGYTRDELMGMTLYDLAPHDEHDTMRAWLDQHGARPDRFGFQEARPRRHRCKDGTIIDVEVTSDDVELGGRHCRVCLCLDVTERNRVNAELAAARDQAVEASNTKSAFLANMSHEIRTPMNGVIGMTELLLDMGLTQEQRECAEQIARSGEQMLAIINDILDLSKIETGHLELELVDFDLPEAIRQASAVVEAQARAKGLALNVEIDGSVPGRARGDGRRIQQVLLNLAANAVKFTHAGAVTVRARAQPAAGTARVRIEVVDTGIGVDETKLAHMFDPFTQADVSTTRMYGGTGLGLAIARELVELMGGAIGATSEPGAGSTFWVEIELAVPAASAEPIAAPPRAAEPVAAWRSAPQVLVAEDSQINQIVAVRALERCGCRVDVVSDGREALAALGEKHYDLVLMDCQMPDMDGYDATRELRLRERGRRIPVIAMTAQAMDGDRTRCLAAGMDDYISKPMRHTELAEVLRRWIACESPGATA